MTLTNGFDRGVARVVLKRGASRSRLVEHRPVKNTLHDEPVDISWHENAGMFVLAVFAIILGVLPFLFFDMMSAYSTDFVSEVLLDVLNEVKP